MLAQSPVYIEMHITKNCCESYFSKCILSSNFIPILVVYPITLHTLKFTEGFATFIFMGGTSQLSKYLQVIVQIG